MIFLANENFPRPSILLLRKNNINISSIAEKDFGISDQLVIDIAIKENRTIVTHDRDYGELVFKYNLKPEAGIIYFKIESFEPEEPGKILLELINQKIKFRNTFTVISDNMVRQRPY